MIIIEGLDGVGKTTLVGYFVNVGMKKFQIVLNIEDIKVSLILLQKIVFPKMKFIDA